MRSPCMRSIGGTPTARWTSEQPWARPSFRNASMRAMSAPARIMRARSARAALCYGLTARMTSAAAVSELDGFEFVPQLGHGGVALVLVHGHRAIDESGQVVGNLRI